MRRVRQPLVALVAAALGLTSIVLATPAGAQVPGALGLEVHGGAAIGAFEATAAGLEFVPEPAWAVSVSWGPSASLGGYLTYAAVGFGCEGGFCRGGDVSFTSRGLSLGVRAEAPVWGEPWVRGGLLLHSLEQRWVGLAGPGEETADADPGVEIAAGLSWRITPRLALVPGLHLGFLPVRAPGGETDNVVFSALDVGLRFTP